MDTTAVTADAPISACTPAICAASSPLMMNSRALVLCVKIQPTLRSLRARVSLRHRLMPVLWLRPPHIT